MNEQTIELLSEIRSGYNCFDDSEKPYYEALSEAIEALKEQAKLKSAVALLEVLLVESLKQWED